MSIRSLSQQFVIKKSNASETAGRLAEKKDAAVVPQRRISGRQFLLVGTQVSLLLLVIRQFQIENPAFLRLMLWGSVGFVVHAWLPLAYRMPFFVLLSVGGLWLVLGLGNGLWVMGLGVGLIGVCHLPLAFAVRVGIAVTVGLALAVLRAEWWATPWSQAIWPILGSMFMFRLMVYLYDLKHETAPGSVWRTLAYFFLLPNVCFPLFPVVDYKTFRRTYYDSDAYQIYQRGVQWMTRGVIQLLLYRLVYYYLTIAPAEVASVGELVQYGVANLFLYLRISGQFHLVVGMLHLFGFHLPETHHQYFLASSFTDYWRRINIYWKDFMLKLFYYPAYFKLRGWGNTVALVGATLVVFVATWVLHVYQWFWLRGTFLLAWQDILFWSILAGLVVVNSLYEAMHSKGRILSKGSWTWGTRGKLALQTVGTFSVICVLWSLWTSESVTEWLALWSVLGGTQVTDSWSIRTVVLIVLLLACLGTAVIPQGQTQQRLAVLKSPAVTIAFLLSLFLTGIPGVYTQFGPKVATTIYPLQSSKLNWMEVDRLERGYYEELLTVDRFNSQLWEVYMNRPLDWLDVQGTGLARPTGDFLQRELIPSSTSYAYRVTIRTNRWGMRDRDYEKQPPPDTYRIAVLGASQVMGLGVEDNETFESLLEDHLNREHAGTPYAKYEILNFAAVAYKPLQQLMVLEKTFAFSPNAVFYVATHNDAGRAASYLAEVIRDKIDIPYEYLRELARRAGIDAETSETVAARRLRSFHDELLFWLYHSIVQACRDRGVLPVWVYMPMPTQQWPEEKIDTQIKQAEEAGFVTLNLRDAYKNQDENTLRLAEWDAHPNAAAHRLIATRLYEVLQEKRTLFFSRLSVHAGKP